MPRKYPVGTNQQYVDATLGEMVLEQFLSDAIQELGIKQSSLEVGTYSVLSTANPAGGLIIFKEDPDDRKYILSLADGFRSFRLLGWLYGHQAKRPTADTAGKYWNTGELASYPGFFVPQEDLNLMETLAER